jgi:alpha-ketoglutarate-dependent 2,4-dichlorophenoxyacetate dioxygenase
MTAISVTRLAPSVAARVDGVDITRPLEDGAFAEIRAAFEEHSVLVFSGQPLSDETQAAFSRRFGPLEVTLSANPAAGTPFAPVEPRHPHRRGDSLRRPPDDLSAGQHALA